MRAAAKFYHGSCGPHQGGNRKALECWQRFDPYRVLGVSRRASLPEIRKTFYKKALVLHPDKGRDKDAFQKLQRAYDEILSERSKTKQDVGTAEDSDEELSKPFWCRPSLALNVVRNFINVF